MKYSKTILFVREVSWNSHYAISTRKIAGEFAENGWNVIWLTPPLMPWHRHPKNDDEQEMFQVYAQGGVFWEENVFAYTPRSYIPFSRRFPLDHPKLANWQWRYCFPTISQVLKQAKVPFPDYLWLSTFHSGGLTSIFKQAKIISHVHDNFSGYPSTPRTCRKIEKEQYQKASIIFASAPSLKQMLINDFGISKNKINILSPGVSLEYYSTGDISCPNELLNLPKPRLVALGNTSKLDFEILEAFVSHPEFVGSVVIVGPVNEKLSQMALQYPNLCLAGSVDSKEVPSYLLNCDIGLILMGRQMTDAAEHTCPMKLYEYAAGGLPVISTSLPIFDHINLPVKIVRQPLEAFTALTNVLQAKEYIRPIMLDFAHQNSWKNKYTFLLDKLQSDTN